MPSPLIRAVPFAVTLPLLAGMVGASAEEHCKFSWESPKGVSKYPHQLALDVGDIPGHKVGVFEVLRINPDFKLPCDKATVVEHHGYGLSDQINRNGRVSAYDVYTLDSGDKIYSQWSGTVQTETAADGSSKTTVAGTATWIGGTGRYQSVRGVMRSQSLIEYEPSGDAKTGQSKFDGEYWFEK
jgi:hypothetical protein